MLHRILLSLSAQQASSLPLRCIRPAQIGTRDLPAPIDEARRDCGPVASAMADCRKASSAAGGCAPALEFLTRFRAGRIDAEDRAALRHLLLHEILEHGLLASLLRHLFGDMLRDHRNAL